MPYSSLDELPDAVKKLPEKKQRQWMAVFNSAYDACIKDGGDKTKCEPSAFAQANGVVNKQENAKNLIEYIYMPIDEAVRAKDEMAWLNDVYADENTGDLFAIITSQGKLYKASITLGATVQMGDWVECKLDFPTIEQMQTRILRQKDGKVRWLSTSCSSVINRNGAIDSRALLQSFVDNAEKTGVYPVRQFCHCGMDFVTGQCDFLTVDDNLLISSGVYNDSELAKREIKAREEDGEYWGESIGFLPTAPPKNLVIEQGVTVPVYDEGTLVEISTVPERHAAAWFTSTIILEEVNRMLEKRQMDALVKIFGGDVDAAKKWLETNVDEVNRSISEKGLVTLLAQEEKPTDPPAPDATPDPEAKVEQEVEQALPPTPPADAPPPADEKPADKPAQTIAIDEDTIKAIGDYILEEVTAKIAEAVKPLQDALDGLQPRMAQAEGAITEMAKNVTPRLAALETGEEEKRRIWLEDAPPKPTIRITHRPRNDGKPETPEEPAPVTLADIAADTLSRLPF